MRILFVSSFALFPRTRFGGAKRLYYLARELAQRHEVHVLCLDGCREWPAGTEPPQDFPRSLYLRLQEKDPKSGLRRVMSLPVDIGEEMRLQRSDLEGFLGETCFDATLLAFPLSLSLLGEGWDGRLGKKVYLEDDLLLETYRQGYAPGAAGPWAARLKQRWRHAQGLAYFRRKLASAAAFVCISKEESDIVRALFPGLAAPLLKYGLPLEEFPPLPLPAQARTLGFIGNYRHGPNLDAALWLARDLFPVLRRRFPDLRLVLAGAGMPAELRQACAAHPGIESRDEVPEVIDFYRGIALFVNPIRSGRGLRTKVVEAAAFGRPVLSTPLGAEGLEELDIPLWEDARGLEAALAALQDPEKVRTLAAANRRAVEAYYSAEALADALAGWLKT